ncbi:unnamed protein product [Haemonchus placei]|uniref:Uncharacterized protein n=1 Tax=Haemonchus placei TaxID=6290 RepID=A0A3P7UFU6_HAEPC|nr:unnamed protein product [Haemonchus placei]
MCNGGCSTCQCLGSAVEVQTCNTAPCPSACTTCQQTQPHYDPPVTQPPCITCSQNQPPPPCVAPSTPTPYIQPAPSSCTTCGVNLRYYDPYSNGGRRKRSQRTIKGPLSFLFN